MALYSHPNQYHPDYIEKVLAHISNRKDETSKRIIKDHFLNRNIIKNEFFNLSDDELKYVLKALVKYHYAPDSELELLMAQIKDDNFIEYKRVSPWYFSDINVLDSDNNYVTHDYCKSNFHFMNKWGHSSSKILHRLIYDKKSFKVLWGDFGNYSDIDLDDIAAIKRIEDVVFISRKDKVYQIYYIPPYIYLKSSPDAQQTKLNNAESDTLDEYIFMFCSEDIDSGYGFILDNDFMETIDITPLTGEKFFDRGINWQYGSSDYINGETPTKIKTYL